METTSRRTARKPVSTLIVATATVTCVVVAFYKWHPEGVIAWVTRSACGDGHTAYSAGYSEAGYWRVRVGMTREQVVKLLGEPLNVFEWPGETVWAYAEPNGKSDDSGFTTRNVILSDGRVRQLGHSYRLPHDNWWC